jgi:hypothetical protein
MSRRRDKVPRRRHITPAPPAPVIRLCLAGADANRRESECARDSCSRCDPLQFHRELLFQLAALPLPRKAACRTMAKTAMRSRLFPDMSIVPLGQRVSHQQIAAGPSPPLVRDSERLCRFVYWIAAPDRPRPVGTGSNQDEILPGCASGPRAVGALPNPACAGGFCLTPSDLVTARDWHAITTLASDIPMAPTRR